MTEREFDLVLLGATGFVGALTAAHLAREAPEGTRIALAARSMDRLQAVRGELDDRARDWPLVEVDALEPDAVRSLAARTRVLATTVGPYVRYGREVIRACAAEGTHYADLTGEVLFVRWSLDTVSELAATTGARIVHACGYDSIPSDLGVLVTADRARQDGEGTLGETVLAVRSAKGGLSGGTIDSGRQQAIIAREDPEARALLRDPYALSPRRDDEPPARPRRSRRSGGGLAGDGLRDALGARIDAVRRMLPVERDPETGRWTGPFVMASFNTRIVRLSNTLTDWSYGRGFRYREVTDFGSSPASPVLAAGMAIGITGALAGLSFAPTRAVLDRFLPAPGTGPDADTRAAGRFLMEIRSTTSTGTRYQTRFGAGLDPGYGGTAVMLGQSALCLALDGDRLPDRSGVLTPATAMGEVLVERLTAQGFTVETHRQT